MIAWAEILLVFGAVTGLATVALHILFAVAVYIDTQKLVAEKLASVFVPGYVWAIATLFGGIFVAIGYWIIHRSSIAILERAPSNFDLNDFRS